MAIAILINPPINTPLAVANGIKRAIKNNTKSGETKRFTTLTTTSYKLPSTRLIRRLKARVKMPTNKERILILLSWSTFSAFDFLENLLKRSSEMTEEVALNPEDKLDMAAARIPAATKPEIPMGRPTSMNFGNKMLSLIHISEPTRPY